MKQFYVSYLSKTFLKKIFIFRDIDVFYFHNVKLIPHRFSSWHKDLNLFPDLKRCELYKEYLLIVKAVLYYPYNPIQQTNYLSGVFRRILEINPIRSTTIKNNNCYVSN